MLGFSGRTRRVSFAIIMTVCFFGSVILMAVKPLIAGLKTLDPATALVIGNIMAIAAVLWTVTTAYAWVVFSVRRLRDAGWHPALAILSIVLGFMNDPRTLIDPGGWIDKPWAIGLTVLCLGWLATLSGVPSADDGSSRRKDPSPAPSARSNDARRQFGLR